MTAAVQDRAIHLVDIENLVGGPRATGREVRRTLDHYLAAAGWRRGDIVCIAANPGLALEFVWDCPVDANIHTACGKDGADLALLAQAAPEFVARRARRLVVGSGDGIFVTRAKAARDLGVAVTVVARPRSLHHDFRQCGFDVVLLEVPADTGWSLRDNRRRQSPRRQRRDGRHGQVVHLDTVACACDSSCASSGWRPAP
jgi:hypothetical protein